MDQKKIGSFLKELRSERGITQEQLAQKLFVSGRTVSRWETGSNLPDLSVLVELADFYDVDIRELINGERKSEMDKETKDTLVQVAQYAHVEKKQIKLKRIITVILLIVFVLHIETYLLYENHQLGREMVIAANDLEHSSMRLARSLDYLNESYNAINGTAPATFEFDNALNHFQRLWGQHAFGSESVPIPEEVREPYAAMNEKLHKLSMFEKLLKQAFTEDEETHGKIMEYKGHLENLSHCLRDFQNRYGEMSLWARYFTNWEQEQQQLADLIRIPE